MMNQTIGSSVDAHGIVRFASLNLHFNIAPS